MAQAVRTFPSSQNLEIPDQSLWVSFRNGDREALEKLYCRYNAALYRYGMRICRDPDMVRDGMQELFSKLWGARGRISDANCVQMYMYRSLRRLLLQQVIRKRRRQTSMSVDVLGNGHVQSIEQSFISREICKEMFVRLRSELQTLSKNQREAIILRFFNALSYVQISEIMGLQIDSVYNLTSKALEILRSRMNLDLPRG